MQVFCKFHSIAGFFACIYDIIRCHYEGNARDICPPLASNPICADCFAHARNDRYKKQTRNDGKNIVITMEWNDRSNPKYILCFFDNNVASAHCVNNSKRSTQGVRHRRPVGKTPCYKKLDCFAYARTRCAPHGDDNIFCDNKNFQFDKFQRLFSVIYKKLINYKGDFKMRNQTNKTIFKQKSKVFLTILCMLGLVFSWSCSCKNRVSNPDDTPTDGGTNFIPPGTFSISEATNNVTTNFVVKTTSTVGEIKIGFVSANNYAYTLSYEVVDNEGADDNSKILKSDTEYANDVLTIKETGLTKIRAIPSVDAPAVRTITINFTFKANDSNLNNNTQNLSVEVKLKHAQMIDNNNLGEILKKMTGETIIDLGVGNPTYGFNLGGDGNTYKEGVYEIKNTAINKVTSFSDEIISKIHEYADYYLPLLDEIKSATRSTSTEGGTGSAYYTITYDIVWEDEYESNSATTVKLKFVV